MTQTSPIVSCRASILSAIQVGKLSHKATGQHLLTSLGEDQGVLVSISHDLVLRGCRKPKTAVSGGAGAMTWSSSVPDALTALSSPAAGMGLPRKQKKGRKNHHEKAISSSPAFFFSLFVIQI